MKADILKELVGEKIGQCTQENFELGYDPITDLIDELEAMSFESFRDKQEYYGLHINECTDKDVQEYYNKILNELMSEIINIKKWRSDFNEQSINSFKRWFFMKFNNVEYLPTEVNLHYYWSNKFIQNIMDLTLEHFEDDYTIHCIGGCINNFSEISSFLFAIAKVPLVHEYITLKDIEQAIIKENQIFAEQLICESETQCIDSSFSPQIEEYESFIEEQNFENYCLDDREEYLKDFLCNEQTSSDYVEITVGRRE